MSSGQTRSNTRRPPRPTTARGPRAGLAISLLLHAGLIAATWFTFRNMMELPESHMVPVDLVVAEQTNVRAEAPPQPPEKIEIPKPELTPPALPQFADAEPAPEPPVPQFNIVKPKTEEQPQKPPQPAKKQVVAEADALLNKILAQTKAPKNAKAGPRVIPGTGMQNMATADLADALKSQIYRCWSPPVGAPNANDLVVDFDVVLNRDGSIARADSAALGSGNPYTLAAAEAARRAVFECQPYHLPPGRYDQWHEINPLRFDPRQMMNQ